MARLEGQTLLLTRGADDAAVWADALAAEGATAVVLPCIRTEAIAAPGLGAALDAALAEADWLAVTSRRGAEAVAVLVADELPAGLKLAAVGRATAERVSALFGRAVDSMGSSTAAALAETLAAEPSIANARVVLALAENAGGTLARTLEAAGAHVERFDVYRTVPAAPIEPKHALSALGCDCVIFASPSAVTGFANQVDVDTAYQMVTIGPSTSAAVLAHGWAVAAEAREPCLSGIIDSLLETTHA